MHRHLLSPCLAVLLAGLALASPVQAADAPLDPVPPPERLSGYALSPVLGYDPIPGLQVGAAWFFYPPDGTGPMGSVKAYLSPSQGRGHLQTDLQLRGPGQVIPRFSIQVENLQGRFYGRGMETEPRRYVTTDPALVDASAGLAVRLPDSVHLGLQLRGLAVHERAAAAVRAAGQPARIDGALTGLRLELTQDTRDTGFSTRSGGQASIWTESWTWGGRALRQRAGLLLTRFFTLRAPDLVLALRVEAGTSAGARADLTDFSLGGGDTLRGYLTDRFRGDHVAAAAAELRVPLVGPLSTAGFVEAGRVWLTRGSNRGGLGTSAGVGLRFGLPPDRLVRLRFDLAFAPDQWGMFFKFNEAF